jgi:hypothetical protein
VIQEERRKIFKKAWIYSIKKDLYPKYINGANVAFNYFYTELSRLLYPENNINDELTFDEYEKSGSIKIRAMKNDMEALGSPIIPFQNQTLENVIKGDLIVLIIENKLLLRKLGSRVNNYIYLGDNLLMDASMGSVINWLDWKENPEWTPRLLFYIHVITGTENDIKYMHKGDKWFRPYDKTDKIIWENFWSGI